MIDSRTPHQQSPNQQSQEKSAQLEVFYDGDCPLCRREINFVRSQDEHQQLRLLDIASADFSAAQHGTTGDALMAQMHVRRADGEWVRGADAFREIYGTLGYRKLVGLSRLPVLRTVADWGYKVFARNRLWITGRRGHAASNSDACDRCQH
ncbi:MAG: thiol-disulfide oxidoreductase [Planctomyces sp.]|nr:thiol-disulfide oxidoreductase [Planctomyces sp.]